MKESLQFQGTLPAHHVEDVTEAGLPGNWSHLIGITKQWETNTCTYFLLFIYSGVTACGMVSGSSHLIQPEQDDLSQACLEIHLYGSSKPQQSRPTVTQPVYNPADGAPS